jgi:PAS domain S-box-containing protein
MRSDAVTAISHREESSSTAALHLIEEVLAIVSTGAPLEETLTDALALIDARFGFPVGAAYVERSFTFEAATAWHAPGDPGFSSLRAAIAEASSPLHAALLAEVFETHAPVWLAETPVGSGLRLAAVARDAGLRGVLALPIITESAVACVLELYSLSAVEPDPATLRILELVAAELSPVLARERVAADIRERDDRFRALLDSSSDAVIFTNLDGRMIAANATAERLTQFAQRELLDMTWLEVIAPEHRESVDAWRARATGAAEREQHFESVALTRSGRRVPITISAGSVERDGVSVGTRVTIRDTSEDTRAQQALRESEDRFRGAFDAAAVGMALMATDGRWLQVNTSFCRFVGYEADELVGNSVVEIAHPDAVESDKHLVYKLFAGEIASFDTEGRYVHKDGHGVWALVSCSLVRSADGAPAYIVAQFLDITERKRAELIAASLPAHRPGAAPISPREREVLSLLAQGLTGGEVATRLSIGEETVQTHVRRAMKKLDARTRTQAVAVATRLGLLDGEIGFPSPAGAGGTMTK